MKTVRQALNSHHETFWTTSSTADCNRWMAVEAQLKAYCITSSEHPMDRAPYSLERAAEHASYARHLMGVTEGDQFYA